eukprot:TRINITY_DN2478_c0_g1_i1.p1 TRINITY_DN2478_c0_g1~~TRINITY_DN2478_c0_g1_i1.p1  ORF type:complete len:569 (+),score=99.42 TRINITY_DN2478_c0_g1_i1:1377-3083(+)
MKKRVCMSLSATPSAKLRSKPALPANQNRFEASSRVKAMPDEYEYLLACREAEAEKNLMLQRQQIAFSAWLNFVFKQPERLSSYMTGTSVDEVVRTMTKDSTENQALCNEIKAAIKIQSAWRRMQHHSKYLTITRAVIKIQSYWRSCLARRYFKVLKENLLLKSCDRNRAAVKIQCAWKGARYQSQFRNWRLAAIRIQSTFRMYLCKKSFQSYKEASVVVQSFTRVELALQNYKHITCDSRNDGTTISASEKAQVVQILTKYMPPSNVKIQKSVLRLQGWWRNIFTCRTSSAMVIQAHIRGWICRKAFSKAITRITCIQAYWRSYRTRQVQIHDDQQQLCNLRARIKVSATNVDDTLRLGNRLTRALEELAKHRTVSGIRHTCVTLDVATQHSKRCCHQLVDARAIDKILKVIVFSNRITAYEETLKHAFSVLSNIAYYPEFAQAIVDTPGSVTIIAEQVLRNRDELSWKAADILKKLCAVQNGLDALRKLHSIIHRMQHLSQSLDKRLETEARNVHKFQKMEVDASRKMAEKRLKELMSRHKSILELLQLVSAKRNTQVIKSRNFFF